MAGAMCINVVDSSQEVCCPIHPRITNWKKNHSIAGESVAGFVGAPSAPSVVSVPSCAVLPSAPSCEMVRDGADGGHSDTTALCDRNVSFQPARNIPSLCWCLPLVPPVSAKLGDRDCYFLFRQNVCTLHERQQQQERKQQQQQSSTQARKDASTHAGRDAGRDAGTQARRQASKQEQRAASSEQQAASSKQQQARSSSSK